MLFCTTKEATPVMIISTTILFALKVVNIALPRIEHLPSDCFLSLEILGIKYSAAINCVALHCALFAFLWKISIQHALPSLYGCAGKNLEVAMVFVDSIKTISCKTDT